MTIQRSGAWRALALSALLGCGGCLGPNHATGHLYNWNSNLGNKWVQAGSFLLLTPVYVVINISDNLIFNPIQWWGGGNPIARPDGVDGFGFIQVSENPLQAGPR
jgi:hypothetical protein